MSTKFTPARVLESLMPPYTPPTREDGTSDPNTTNGYIWFAVDTGRIFVDTPKERVTVGGNGVAILYGDFPKDVEPDEEGICNFAITSLA